MSQEIERQYLFFRQCLYFDRINDDTRVNMYWIWLSITLYQYLRYGCIRWNKSSSNWYDLDNQMETMFGIPFHEWPVYFIQPTPYSIFREICTRFCFAVLCCGYTLADFPISIRLTSLALWQSNDCPSASKTTLMNMDKYFMWIHYERLHNHNKAKHNKTVCIFLGIYCNLHRQDVSSHISDLVISAAISRLSHRVEEQD